MTIDYSRISEYIKKHSGLVTALNLLDKAITYITVVLYLALLVYLYFIGAGGNRMGYVILYRSILIPGVSFVVVSIFRRKIAAPRPYEVYNFSPAIKKDTVGKSFPSRHVFSIFIVAATYMQVSVELGLFIGLMGIILAMLRVFGGVHFVKDVICGCIIGILCGFIGFGVLCGVFNIGMILS